MRQAFTPETNAECAIAETSLAEAERRYDDAVRHASSAVALLEQAGNTRSTRYTSALTNLAVIYSSTGRFLEALAAQRHVTENSRQIGRAKTTAVVISLSNEGTFLRDLGRWVEADQRFVEAIELARGADRTRRVPGAVLVNRARLLVSLARGDEALALIQQARSRGELSPHYAALSKLSEALARIDPDNMNDARTIYNELKSPERTGLRQSHAHTVAILGGRIAQAERKLPEARAVVDHALQESGFPAKSSAGDPELLEYAGRLSLELSDIESAIRRCQEAIRRAEAQFGRDAASAFVGRARLTLGIALASKGATSEARKELQQASATLERAAGSDHPWTVEARTRLAALGS